jgi:sulfoxide reductase heme-binding subunit YedZ
VSDAPSRYVWWLAGRSAGIVALALITASVLLGLAMAARAIPTRRRRAAMSLHEQIALAGLAAIAAHGLLLAGDPWLRAGLKGILVPFAIHYRPLWTSLGIIGGYLAAILALSFYARRRIGARTWRRMHRLTVLAYVVALAHALGSGTDAALAPVRYATLASALPVLALFVLRMQRSRSRAAARAGSRSRGRGAGTHSREHAPHGSLEARSSQAS